MTDRQVLKIPVDSSEFDAFTDKFMAYQKDLEGQPAAWAGTTQGVKQTAKAFDQVQSAFDDLVKAATSPKFADKSSGTFARFEKSSKATAGYWHNMSRDLEKSSKYFDGFVRSGIKWGSLVQRGALAGIGLAGAGIAAVNSASGSIADQAATGRNLDLPAGSAQDFEDKYSKKYHLGTADLAKLNEAKYDQNNAQAFGALGVDFRQAKTIPTDVLEADMQTRLGQLVRDWKAQGLPVDTMMQQRGIDKLFSFDQAQQAGATSDEEKRKDWNSYQGDLPRYAISDKEQKDATQAWNDVETAFHTSVLAIQKDLVHLAPDIVALEKKFGGMVEDFAKSSEVKKDLDELSKGLTELSSDLPSIDKFTTALNDASKAVADNAKWWHDLVFGKTTGGGATGDQGFEDKMLHAIEMNESGGVNGKTNPDSGAAGLMQITPANYKAAGIDPMDPVANRALGKQIYEGFLHKYHGDPAKAAAAYDGFAGLDKDIAKHGDKWRDFIGDYQNTGETIKYLNDLEKQGIDLSGGGASGGASKWDGPMPADIQGFKVEPYTSDEANAKAQSDASYLADPAEQSIKNYIKQHWEDFEGLFKTRRGEPEYQFQQPAPAKPMQTSMLSVPQTVRVVVPPGYSTAATVGGLA